jgi:hypothetical protein
VSFLTRRRPSSRAWRDICWVFRFTATGLPSMLCH